MIRVLIADDEALVRAGFCALVDSAPDLSVIGEAGTGTQAVRLARQEKPHVVLMDIRMPMMDGLEATRLLLTDQPGHGGPRVLIVTTFDQDAHVFAALRHGASGFVLKDTPPEQLLDAIRVVAAGEALLAPALTRRLITEFVRRTPTLAPDRERLDELTDRELEVLAQVAYGRSNAEIADALVLSMSTIKTHIGRLLAKLAARDRAQLVVVAYETGLITASSRTP